MVLGTVEVLAKYWSLQSTDLEERRRTCLRPPRPGTVEDKLGRLFHRGQATRLDPHPGDGGNVYNVLQAARAAWSTTTVGNAGTLKSGCAKSNMSKAPLALASRLVIEGNPKRASTKRKMSV